MSTERSRSNIQYMQLQQLERMCFPLSVCWLYRQLRSHGTGKQRVWLSPCFLDVTCHSSCCNGIPIVDGLQTTLCVASIRLSWQAIWYFLAELLLSLHREFMNCGFYILMFCQLWQDSNKGQYIFLFNWESLFISYYEDNWENCVFWHF